MKNFLKSSLIATSLAFGTLASSPIYAADEINVEASDDQTAGLAVQGYDVISYRTDNKPVLGTANYTTDYDGATYRFASQANLDQFKADPARYAPAFGGFCAYGVAKGKKFEIDPAAYSVVDDVLYLNYNQSIQKKWVKKQAKYIDEADGNWTDIRAIAIDDL